MGNPKAPRVQRIGNAIFTGAIALGIAGTFGAKMAHPSIVMICVFFAAAWGVSYLLYDWIFITRPEQVKKNVPITGAERQRREKQFFDSLPRS